MKEVAAKISGNRLTIKIQAELPEREMQSKPNYWQHAAAAHFCASLAYAQQHRAS